MKKEEEKKDKKNKKILLIILGIVLLIALFFILWFFNRKFDVTFDYNNGTKNEIVKVKYNKAISEENIKTSKELGEKFIGWYKVKEVKDGKDILEDKPFDFNVKIKENIKLKAIYDATVETVTISFNTDGGSEVASVIINKGSSLSLPEAPTKSEHKFFGWFLEDGKEVTNDTIFEKDTTLYAKWEKIVKPVVKPDPKPEVKPTPKPEVKEESISLSLSNTLLHRNGNNTSKAVATTKNVSGSVVYSVNSTCVSINSNTGDITATSSDESCKKGTTVVVTATTPKGKIATANLTLEQDLELMENGNIITDRSYYLNYLTANITSNVDVTWDVSCTVSGGGSKYPGNLSKSSNKVSFDLKCLNDEGESTSSSMNLTATTKAGQFRKVQVLRYVN